MVIEIDTHRPILDYVIPTVKELVRDKEATIVSNQSDLALQLMLDIVNVIHEFYPYIDVNIYPDSPRLRSQFIPSKDVECVEKYTLNLIIEDSKKPLKHLDKDFVTKAYLTRKNKKIPAISTNKSENSNSLELYQKLHKTLYKLLNKNIKGERDVGLCFYYSSPASFKVNIFKQFEPIEQKYPISSEPFYSLEHEAWLFFSQPLYFYGGVVWAYVYIDKLLGKSIRSKILPGIIEKHLQRGRTILHGAMDPYINFDELCRKLGYPKAHQRFIHNLIKTIDHFANPKTIKSEEVKLLLEDYNSVNERPLTAKELCIDRFDKHKKILKLFF